jgi:small subunit ribosomal protein S20
MANHPSAEKRNRQRITRTVRNRAIKSSLRTTLKKARGAVAAGEKSAGELVLLAEKALARAASKGVLTKKTAARVTSRIAASVHKKAPKKGK